MIIAMDPEQQFAFDSDMPHGVLGKGEDFVLVPLGIKPPDAALLAEATAKGFAWCGVFGLLNGKPEARLSPDNHEAIYTMCFAGLAFAHLVADHLRPEPPKGDEVLWLQRLHALQDLRPSAYGPN